MTAEDTNEINARPSAKQADLEVFRAAVCIAGMDRQIANEERQFLRRMAGLVGMPLRTLRSMIQHVQDEPEFYEAEFRLARTKAPDILRLLCRVAAADGRIAPEEWAMLQRLGEKLGVAEAKLRDMLSVVIAETNLDAGSTGDFEVRQD